MKRTGTIMTRRILGLALFITVVVAANGAGGVVEPGGVDLARSADAIVVGTVLSTSSRFAEDGTIVTDVHFAVEESRKGDLAAGASIVITERGGVVDGVAMLVSGVPHYVPGERALVHLEQEDGRWRTHGRERGRIPIGRGDALRDFSEPIIPLLHVPANDYLTQFAIGSLTRGARWPTGTFTMLRNGTQTGVADLDAAIGAARSAWNAHPQSSIEILIGGTGSGEYGQSDNRNNLFFDQPNSGKLAGTTVGEATVWANSLTVTNERGEQFYRIVDCDIIIERGLTGRVFEEVLAHEMGHCLGFRHSNDPQEGQLTRTSDALMNASVRGEGAFLRPWDEEAANHVYGDGRVGAPCPAPAILRQPADRVIAPGASATLRVAASGTDPLHYQWFRGGPPGSGTAVAGATEASFNTGPLFVTQSFSVRVTDPCGAADSLLATVTVVPDPGRRRPASRE